MHGYIRSAYDQEGLFTNSLEAARLWRSAMDVLGTGICYGRSGQRRQAELLEWTKANRSRIS